MTQSAKSSLIRVAVLMLLLGIPAAGGAQVALEPAVKTPITIESDDPVAVSFRAPEGALVVIEAEQTSANVAIALHLGDVLVDRVAASAPPGVERLEYIAAPGLSLRLEPADGSRGEVVILGTTRTARPVDLARVEGVRLSHEADRLMNEQRAEAQDEAIAAYERSIALLREADAPAALAYSLDGLAWAISTTGDKRRALPLAEEALRYWKESRDSNGEMRTLQMLGLLHLYLGNWQKSLDTNATALEMAREAGDRSSEAGILHNIGGIHWSIDEMERALDFYGRALAVGESHVNDRSRSSTLNNIGDAYRRLGDFDTALEYFHRAYELREKSGNRSGQAHSLHTTGLVHLETGDASKAYDYFTRALEIRKAVGDARGEAYSLGGTGAALFQLGKPAEALEYQKKALEKWAVIGERRAEAETRHEMGRTLNALGRSEEALAALRLALPVSQELRDHTTEAEIWLAIATTERDAGNLDEARRSVERAIEVIDRLRAGIASSELRTSYFARVRRFYDFYVDLLMRTDEARPGEGWSARGFEISERARARTFLETLAMARLDIRQGVDKELLAAEADVVRRLRLAEKTRAALLEQRSAPAEIEKVETEIGSLAREYDEVVARIRRQSPAYAELVMPAPVSEQDVRALIADGTVLVASHVGDETSYVWFIGRDRPISWRRFSGGEEVDEVARSFHQAVTARSRETSAEAIAAADRDASVHAARLSEWLRPDESLEGTQLVYVPDGALHYIAPGMLPAADGRELIRSWEVVTIPSVSVLAALRERGTSSADARSIAIFADPVFRSDDPRVAQAKLAAASANAQQSEDSVVLRSAEQSGLAALPRLRFSRREAEAITALAGDGVRQALDFEASRSLLNEIDLTKYGVLHFATHGLVNSREPALSGLVLSLVGPDGEQRNGFLSLQEIYNLDLHARLVVLSACQTALGDEVRGEGLVGMTRGFMYAGANSVIASLWQVDDRATSMLMQNLYEQMLSEGRTPSAALRSAQLEMLDQERWAAPYYWAAFQIQGDWLQK